MLMYEWSPRGNGREKGERKETGMDRRREKQTKEDERASVGGWMERKRLEIATMTTTY